MTRAATGIGKAIAGALAAAAARAVLDHPHTPELAAAAVADIQAAGGTALAVAADISDRAQYQTMVERLLRVRPLGRAGEQCRGRPWFRRLTSWRHARHTVDGGVRSTTGLRWVTA